jgi:hypothetical protein
MANIYRRFYDLNNERYANIFPASLTRRTAMSNHYVAYPAVSFVRAKEILEASPLWEVSQTNAITLKAQCKQTGHYMALYCDEDMEGKDPVKTENEPSPFTFAVLEATLGTKFVAIHGDTQDDGEPYGWHQLTWNIPPKNYDNLWQVAQDLVVGKQHLIAPWIINAFDAKSFEIIEHQGKDWLMVYRSMFDARQDYPDAEDYEPLNCGFGRSDEELAGFAVINPDGTMFFLEKSPC